MFYTQAWNLDMSVCFSFFSWLFVFVYLFLFWMGGVLWGEGRGGGIMGLTLFSTCNDICYKGFKSRESLT